MFRSYRSQGEEKITIRTINIALLRSDVNGNYCFAFGLELGFGLTLGFGVGLGLAAEL